MGPAEIRLSGHVLFGSAGHGRLGYSSLGYVGSSAAGSHELAAFLFFATVGLFLFGTEK